MARTESEIDGSSTAYRHWAIAERLEPIREHQERQIADKFRDEDNWFSVPKLYRASEIDRLPGNRH
jgi:hypothetical protein